MELNTLENEILMDIYDADMLPGITFDIQNYILKEESSIDKKQEFAFHLIKLKNLGYIKFEEQVFLKSGNYSNKYNNNVTKIYEDKIHIDFKGINFVEWYISGNSEILTEMHKCG